MKITDRIKLICPEADVYWSGEESKITLIYPENIKIDANLIQIKICTELDMAGLLRAVEKIRILQ
jgi:hypothetical protein